jgi:hypothetical protein
MANVKKRPSLPENLPRRTTRRTTANAPIASTATPNPREVAMVRPLARMTSDTGLMAGAMQLTEDLEKCRLQWRRTEVEGYGGLIATIAGECAARL